MIIEKSSGERIDLKDTNITPLKFIKSSPSPRFLTETIDSVDGDIPMNTMFGPRKILATFFVKAVDNDDYYLQTNEVFRLFMTKEPFFIVQKKEPGKRWKVQAETEFSLERIARVGSFEIQFISFSPYAESVGTTLNAKDFDSNLWQVGQGLITDTTNYVHQSTTFRIFNASDIEIDPRERPLRIAFTGPSNGLTITNTTTGDVWQYNGPTQAGQTIEINGISTLLDGSSVFRSTNRKLISLAPGWNDFILSGETGPFVISYDFRFYYI